MIDCGIHVNEGGKNLQGVKHFLKIWCDSGFIQIYITQELQLSGSVLIYLQL